MKTNQYKNLKQGYYATGERERYCITNLFNKLSKLDVYTYEFRPTTTFGSVGYEGILYQKDGNKVKKVWLIEAKVRETNYPDYVLEKSKKDTLYRLRNELNMECEMKYGVKLGILYVNFVPQASIIWDLDKLDRKGLLDNKHIKKRNMNKITIESTKNKVSKKGYYLKPSDGKYITEYIFTTKDYLRHLEQENMNKTIMLNEIKTKTFDLMELFDKNNLKKKVYK